jgi:hypothetical protein
MEVPQWAIIGELYFDPISDREQQELGLAGIHMRQVYGVTSTSRKTDFAIPRPPVLGTSEGFVHAKAHCGNHKPLEVVV